MYAVNKNLCLFKIFHVTYLFAQFPCELYDQNQKPIQSLQYIIMFHFILAVCAPTFNCLHFGSLDLLVVVIINAQTFWLDIICKFHYLKVIFF